LLRAPADDCRNQFDLDTERAVAAVPSARRAVVGGPPHRRLARQQSATSTLNVYDRTTARGQLTAQKSRAVAGKRSINIQTLKSVL
jgi:hypothetical protein